jgi:hypothetical protein
MFPAGKLPFCFLASGVPNGVIRPRGTHGFLSRVARLDGGQSVERLCPVDEWDVGVAANPAPSRRMRKLVASRRLRSFADGASFSHASRPMFRSSRSILAVLSGMLNTGLARSLPLSHGRRRSARSRQTG